MSDMNRLIYVCMRLGRKTDTTLDISVPIRTTRWNRSGDEYYEWSIVDNRTGETILKRTADTTFKVCQRALYYMKYMLIVRCFQDLPTRYFK